MKLKIFFSLFVVLSTMSIFSQESMLKRLQEKFTVLSDFKASFEQTIAMVNSPKETKMKGEFYYKKGNKYIIEINQQKIVSDGTTLWNYNKKLKRTVINNVSDEVSTFSLEKIIFEYPKNCEISENLQAKTIKLSPNDEEVGFNSAIIKLDAEGMIKEITITDFNDTVFKVNLLNIYLNNKFEDSFFVLNPPAGGKIVDLR